MAAIRLKSSSGKWTHTTKVDDPLFAPILGAMLEEGMTLPEELELPGSVGEELEKNWHLIGILHQWKKWAQKCKKSEVKNYYGMRNMILDMPPVVKKVAVEHIVYSPPTEVVWRHQIAVLAGILNLPEGWELYTAVDSRTPLVERIYHMKAVLEIMRKNTLHSKILAAYTTPSTDNIRAPYYKLDEDSAGHQRILPVLDPFIRNQWLCMRGTPTQPSKGPCITLYALLLDVDWEVVIQVLEQQEDKSEKTRTREIISLANTLTGKITKVDELEIPINLQVLDYSTVEWYVGDQTSFDINRITVLYSRLLTYIPDDVHPAALGLHALFAWYPKKTKGDVRGIRRLVGQVNAWILSYYMRLPDTEISMEENTMRNIIKPSTALIVYLSRTIGLCAMRRILLCLLHYIDRNEKYTRKPPKEGSSDAVMRKRRVIAGELVQANKMCTLLEEYLEKLDGQDEGVRTLIPSSLDRDEDA